jgi:hypothetical protein
MIICFSRVTTFRSVTEESKSEVLFGVFNPLNAELNPIRHLLALVGARHIVHVGRIRVKHVSIFGPQSQLDVR